MSSSTPGWTLFRTLDDPRIQIMGSRAASATALNAVATIYADMTTRLQPLFDHRKLDGFTVYLTNGEPWSELRTLAPIGSMRSSTTPYGVDESDERRGGATASYLWLDEQMICKKGVRTRNEAHAAGKRAERDDIERTFDQVIHEFAHSVDMIYGLRSRIQVSYKNSRLDPDPHEAFAIAAQHYFGCPDEPLTYDDEICVVHTFSAPQLPAYSVPDGRPSGRNRTLGPNGKPGPTTFRQPRQPQAPQPTRPSPGPAPTSNSGRIAPPSRPAPIRIPPGRP